VNILKKHNVVYLHKYKEKKEKMKEELEKEKLNFNNLDQLEKDRKNTLNLFIKVLETMCEESH
jgi:hypothetical protein